MRVEPIRVAAAFLVSLILLTAVMAQYAPPPNEQDKVSGRLRQLFPENADAKKEITEAIQAAGKEHKRVLVVFGASWCFDCYALDFRFHQPNIAPIVDNNYRVVHVDIGQGDKNIDIAKQYDTPVEAIPAVAVLNQNGKLLYSQKRHEFSSARSLDPTVIAAFLEKWKPSAKAGAAHISGK
jgi:thiol:disulfide interchange protein